MSISHFYVAMLGFFLGVFVASLFSVTLPTLTWLMLLAVVSVLFWRRGKGDSSSGVFIVVGIMLVFFVLGAGRFVISASHFAQSIFDNQVEQKIEVEGVVAREPDRRANSLHLYIKVENGEVILVTTDRYHDVAYDDVVIASGKLQKPEAFQTDLGRTFDYPGYLLAKGVKYQISFAEVEVLREGEGNFVVGKILSFKQKFMNKLEEVIAEPAVGLGEGLLLGVKRALGEDLELAFRKTGIIHIVVLSGYNVMLVVAFVMFVLGYFLGPRARVIAGVIAIGLFAILVGFSATVVRACLMASLLLVAHAYGRIYLVLRALMLAGVVMLILNPYLLVYDIGFQLSFLATLGLILVAPVLEKFFTYIPGKYGLKTFFMATLATQIAVLPLLLYHIGEFSLVAVLVNVLVLPIVPVAMLLTFITGMAGFVSSTVSVIFAIPTYFVLQFINEIALWFGGLFFSSMIVPAFPFYLVAVSYCLLGYFIWRNYQTLAKEGYGDLAQDLLEKTFKQELKQDDLKGWTVVEEFDEELGTKKLGLKTDKAIEKTEVPIFFR